MADTAKISVALVAVPGVMPSDAELLAQALAGDEAAFASLYRRRQAGVFRFALQMTGDRGVAEDVVQEAFLVLLNAGARYDAARGTVQGFLYGIARKLVLRHLERGFSSRFSLDADGPEPVSASDVLGDLTRQETIDAVRRAVLALPAAYREAVVLCDLEEASYEDAALALDCPVGTVRSRLNRGRGLLARKLGIEMGSASGAPERGAPPLSALRSIE